MFHYFARLLIGPAASDAASLAPDIGGLARPGRPPQWLRLGEQKCLSINVKAEFVEPFFNHVAGDTRWRNAA